MNVKLMTKEIIDTLPPLRSTEHTPDAKKKIIAKFFTPDSSWTWYVAEGEHLGKGDYEFFGYVEGHENEWGYFRLSDLEKIRGKMGLPVERDRHLSYKTFAEIPSLRAREKNPGARRHTKKFDRCVKAVKRKGGALNAYAVCHSRIKKSGLEFWIRDEATKKLYKIPARDRQNAIIKFKKAYPSVRAFRVWPRDNTRGYDVFKPKLIRVSPGKNPLFGFTLAAKNGPRRAYYNGEEFVSGKAEAKVFASVAAARTEARRLMAGGHRLKPGWKLVAAAVTTKNPVSPGERLYKSFHGEPPKKIKHHTLPAFRRGIEVGPLVAVTYDTLRDGKHVRYEHEFKQRASPLLTVSDDGRKMAVIGGDFRFTDRGFIDHPK